MKKFSFFYYLIWIGLYAVLSTSVWAANASGKVEIIAIVNGKPVPAVVKINKSKDRVYAYWSIYQPGGPTLPTPLTVPLLAGEYFLHVRPLGLYSPIKEKIIPFSLTVGDKLTHRIVFPVGHLKVTSTEQNSNKAVDTLISVNEGWRQLAPAQGQTLNTPADIMISPGKYEVKATKTNDKQRLKKSVIVTAGKSTQLNLEFKSSHYGYLDINVEMNGKNLSLQQYARYGQIFILNSKNQKKVHQKSGGYGKPYQLSSGIYDIKFHSSIVNDKDILIKNIVLEDNQLLQKQIILQPPGEINISALWTDKPKNIIKCIKSKNPFDPKKVGTLMGGPGGSPGVKCFDETVYSLITEFISISDQSKKIVRSNDIYVKPGLYKIKVWPYDHKELSKTIDVVEVGPGANKKTAFKYPWPFVENKIKINNKYVTRLERKTPLGTGEVHIAATINGQPTIERALFSVNKLNFLGDEANGLFQFNTPDHGNLIGLKLPLQKSIPAGFYHAYVEPFGSHLVLQKKRFDFFMDADGEINKTINFNTGQLKITQANSSHVKQLRLAIRNDNNTYILHRYHKNKLPFNAKITPGDYKIELYSSNNALYFSKKITIKKGGMVDVLVP